MADDANRCMLFFCAENLARSSHYQAVLIRQLVSKTSSYLFSYLATSPRGGVAMSLSVLSAWAISFSSAFSTGAEAMGPWGCLLLIPWFTFLYTGLFVTGHDSMHGSIAPCHPGINRALGEISLFFYGLIPYDKLYQSHFHHHQFPASHRDPDFHNGQDSHPVFWYFRFMRSYWTLRQTVGICIIYNVLHRVVGVPEANLLMFWAIPSLLSSVQLFYFGTYLVHREQPDTYSTPLCANSLYWPEILSLLSCYHFGYHREHHAFPEVPWWQLSRLRVETCPQVINSRGYPLHSAQLVGTQLVEAQLAEAQLVEAKYKPASNGKALETISRPLVQRDRTRLNT